MKKLAALMLTTLLFLQGCAMVDNAASADQQLDAINTDRTMTNEIIDKINAIPEINGNSHVNVSTFNQVVLLTGEANTAEWRQKIEAAARQESGIIKLYNVIEIRGSNSTLSEANDSWITTKIKAQMLATKDLESTTIKVVTANGTVYLMGVVDKEQADTAVDIARAVTGVTKVVKIFQYTAR